MVVGMDPSGMWNRCVASMSATHKQGEEKNEIELIYKTTLLFWLQSETVQQARKKQRIGASDGKYHREGNGSVINAIEKQNNKNQRIFSLLFL